MPTLVERAALKLLEEKTTYTSRAVKGDLDRRSVTVKLDWWPKGQCPKTVDQALQQELLETAIYPLLKQKFKSFDRYNIESLRVNTEKSYYYYGNENNLVVFRFTYLLSEKDKEAVRRKTEQREAAKRKQKEQQRASQRLWAVRNFANQLADAVNNLPEDIDAGPNDFLLLPGRELVRLKENLSTLTQFVESLS